MAPNQVDLRICESGERESARARDALRLGQKIGGQMGGGRGDWDSVIFPRDILYWRRGGRGGAMAVMLMPSSCHISDGPPCGATVA